MIIFDLDGTLAHCEHRRHLVDPTKSGNHVLAWYVGHPDEKAIWFDINTKKKFVYECQAFYEVLDRDVPIEPVIDIFREYNDDEYNSNEIQIWSGRCESVRKKTETWLDKYTSFGNMNCRILKMRPIGDNMPDYQLKEKWLDEHIKQKMDESNITRKWSGGIELKPHEFDYDFIKKGNVDFVFDSDSKSIAMWRRRGIFVFNCCQHDTEF